MDLPSTVKRPLCSYTGPLAWDAMSTNLLMPMVSFSWIVFFMWILFLSVVECV